MYVLTITILGRQDTPVVVHSIPGFDTPALAEAAGQAYRDSLSLYDLTVKTLVMRQSVSISSFGSPQ